MKRFIALGILFLSIVCATFAQNNNSSYTVEGNTFISSTGEHSARTKAQIIETDFMYREKDGTEYKIMCNANTGSCFINKVSRNNREYRKYLGEDISREVCRRLNIEYKGRTRQANNT